LKFVDFYETKNIIIEPMCEQFKKWEQNGHKVDVVQMDNGGENLKLEKQAHSNDWKLGITFEKTAQDTPQQNRLAEIGITVVANKARAMAHANIPTRSNTSCSGKPTRQALYWTVLSLYHATTLKTQDMSIGAAVIRISRTVFVCGVKLALSRSRLKRHPSWMTVESSVCLWATHSYLQNVGPKDRRRACLL
jgi:hypothetical protein